MPADANLPGPGLTWLRIGREWVQGGATPSYHGEHSFFFSARTGQWPTSDGLGPTFVDLDHQAGFRPLCAPLTSTGDFYSDTQAPEFRISQRWTFRRSDLSGAILQRCGASSGLFLSDVSAFTLTRRNAVWVTGNRLRVRDLRTGRVRDARLSGPTRHLQAVGEVVYVGGDGSAPAPRWRVAL